MRNYILRVQIRSLDRVIENARKAGWLNTIAQAREHQRKLRARMK